METNCFKGVLSQNVIQTFRNGSDSYKKLDGIGTGHADWHTRYTSYKVVMSNVINH